MEMFPFLVNLCIFGGVIANIDDSQLATTPMATSPTNLFTTTARTTLSPDDLVERREARGMMDMLDYDHDIGHDDEEEHEMKMVPKEEEPKAVQTDPWSSYYDFLISEGSFKFWAVFQLATAVLLIYSAFAAVYYAKFNPISSDYDYYDDFFRRRSSSRSIDSNSWFNMDSATFQRIIDAITAKKYT